ncbi:MAG: hypothetical protein WKF70_02910 [Chitinophagaceae bacterium]
MKWKKRSAIYVLLAGLILSINSCRPRQHSLTLLAIHRLTTFSSASAIEFTNNTLFVVGDDAPTLLLLDSAYREIKRIPFFSTPGNRIPKELKPDLEASALIHYSDRTYLYVFGSLSAPNRRAVYSFPLDSPQNFTKSNYNNKFSSEIKAWNIEGATLVNDVLLLANRANNSYPYNHLVVETYVPGGKVANSTAKTLKLSLPGGGKIKGVSGLHYVAEKDLLFFTASEEDTPDALQDGAIGNSYLGWIDHFSNKVYRKETGADGFINLSAVHEAFRTQKIESVCLEKMDSGTMILHLAADNDNGESTLFKVALRL